MPDATTKTLLDRLVELFPTAKRQTLRRMTAEGRVLINGRRVMRVSIPLAPSDKVTVAAPRATDPNQLIAPLRIVHEDDDLLVVDKPAGLLTSTVPGEKRPTALKLVRAYLAASSPRARVGLIHRLDRDASGLLVFSKSHRAYESLKTQFFKHTVDRIYQATVRGKPSPDRGRIKSNLIERADGTVRSTTKHAAGQLAITEYEVVSSQAGTSTLRVRLHTGRKHQIRVHLSEKGFPIVGDRVYGDSKQPDQLALRAIELGFDHPATGKRVRIQASATVHLGSV